MTNNSFSEGTISIIDASGRNVYKDILKGSSDKIEIDMKTLPSGIYMLNINLDGLIAQRKFIIE